MKDLIQKYVEIAKEYFNKKYEKMEEAIPSDKQEEMLKHIRKYWQEERPTDKTKEQILAADHESLNFEEKLMRSWMERNPEMTLEDVIEFLKILP